ncbi:hypothetical protein JKP88DRAFT_327423 [Tribonema minus]|uniref:Uncharacterized protein n=1 Tax=Tribonema minus TaxID=303371 RepID=A0A835YZ23_9STRA|nr:hypothetical protein JKP88DRAFT_327423 [Tribonema minus]
MHRQRKHRQHGNQLPSHVGPAPRPRSPWRARGIVVFAAVCAVVVLSSLFQSTALRSPGDDTSHLQREEDGRDAGAVKAAVHDTQQQLQRQNDQQQTEAHLAREKEQQRQEEEARLQREKDEKELAEQRQREAEERRQREEQEQEERQQREEQEQEADHQPDAEAEQEQDQGAEEDEEGLPYYLIDTPEQAREKVRQREEKQREAVQQRRLEWEAAGGVVQGLLKCDLHQGEGADAVKDIAYWKHVAQDANGHPKIKDIAKLGPAEKYVTFEIDEGGWNNIR